MTGDVLRARWRTIGVTPTVEGRMLSFLPEIRTTTSFFVAIPGAESVEVVYVGAYDTIPGQKGLESIESDEKTAEGILLSNDTICERDRRLSILK